MSDLTARAIADLKAELEQQRTRAEAAEQELRELRIQIGQHPATKAWAESSIGAITALQDKLAAIRAHLVGVDWKDLDRVMAGKELAPIWRDLKAMVAAAREALEP